MSARRVVVLGGTGFVGRALAERWAPEHGRLRFLVHRGHPDWLASGTIEVRRWDVAAPATLDAAVDGAHAVINLLRPDGSGWLVRCAREIFPMLGRMGVSRTVHASSIDVYGRTRETQIDETTPCAPLTPYEREHAELEALVADHAPGPVILRLGAVFGAGGSNLVSLLDELRAGPAWKIAARRSLYGKRRMHLVPAGTVADAFRFFALREDVGERVFVVTDDEAPANHFRHVQDRLAHALGRKVPAVPALPPALLRILLAQAGRSNVDPMRRFSGDRLARAGFVASEAFEASLEEFALRMAASSGGLQP